MIMWLMKAGLWPLLIYCIRTRRICERGAGRVDVVEERRGRRGRRWYVRCRGREDVERRLSEGFERGLRQL